MFQLNYLSQVLQHSLMFFWAGWIRLKGYHHIKEHIHKIDQLEVVFDS